MTYAEAVDHLYALGPELAVTAGGPKRKFDLSHMVALCKELGDPQKAVPAVLIAGTNGKGSTAATLAAILTAAGYRTGLYTSPHLVRPNERIQMGHAILPGEYGSATVHGADGAFALTEIADDDFARLYTEVDGACERLLAREELPVLPSFFERVTAIAFLYFAEGPAEIAVLEVGLGGRLDATNVVMPLVSVITDIALDHQEWLGTTLGEIAREKCGILRAGVPLVTLSQHPEANQAIGEAAAALGVEGVNAGEYLPQARRNGDGYEDRGRGLLPRNRYTVQVEGAGLAVDSPLSGAHQQRNVALAIAAAVTLRNRCGYNIANDAISLGISATRWAGRLEWMAPNLLLDVAHNPAGAWTLRAALGEMDAATPRTLLFSCLKDKDLEEMSRILFPLFDSSSGEAARAQDHVVLAPISNARAAAVGDLLAAAQALGVPAHAAPHLAGALAQARRITPEGGVIVVTGSVYLVGEVREMVLAGELAHA